MTFLDSVFVAVLALLAVSLILSIIDAVYRIRGRRSAAAALGDMQTRFIEALERFHNEIKRHTTAEGVVTRNYLDERLSLPLPADPELRAAIAFLLRAHTPPEPPLVTEEEVVADDDPVLELVKPPARPRTRKPR